MTAPRHPDLPALDALRDELHAAAQREMPEPARPARLRRRRVLIAALAGLVIAGGATASQLISRGTPVKDRPGKASRYAPRSPQTALPDALAPDKARTLPWGVFVYTSSSGLPCAIAAQSRAGEPGLVVNGVFHPNAPNTAGACGKPGRAIQFIDIRVVSSAPARWIVYGRAKPGTRRVSFQVRDGRKYHAAVGPRGGFLFVFGGRVEPGPYHMAAD
jgi:hypothetical protein